MMLATLVFAIALCQDRTAVDHSAEPALRQIFRQAGDLRFAHAFITLATTSSGDWYSEQQTSDLYLGAKGQYRLETIGNMGDESLLVSDGMSVMNDPLSDDDPIVLNRASKPLHEITPREPLAYLLEGEAGYDKLVDPAQPIVFAKADSGQKAIELHSKDLGKIVIVYRDGANDPLPLRIDLYRSPRRRNAGLELPYATSREYIRLTGTGPQPSSLFAITTPKGKKVDDQRQKSIKGE